MRQTHPDGVNREQATAYHRFVLDFVILLVVLARRGALRPSPRLEAMAERMTDYLMHATAPDGTLMAIGDADDGRGFLSGTAGDGASASGALSVGAVLFNRPDFKFAAGHFSEEAFWLLGPDGLSAFEQLAATPPASTSAAFPNSGHYIIRDGWSEHGDCALIRCGEFGLAGNGYCAHAHCDLLSPRVWLAGRPLLIDSGTFRYCDPWRDRFRLTAAHNGVIVDDCDQATPTGPFNWRGVPAARCELWEERRVAGSLMTHDVILRRELDHPQPGVWRAVDSFAGLGHHHIEWFFHFAPDLIPVHLQYNQRVQIISQTHPDWVVELLVPAVEIAIEEDWIAPRYGVRARHKIVHARWQGDLDSGAATFVWQFSRLVGVRHHAEAT